MSLSSPAPALVEAATACPDEMDLLAWRDGTLSVMARDRVSAHLRACSLCRATVSESTDRSDRAAYDATATASDDAALGARLAGRYELRGELGRGATSVVFRAFDVWTETEVALKQFTGRLGTHVGHELALGRRMQHPNVCRVFDVGEADGQSYLTMELIEGETLAARLRQRQLRTTFDPVPMLTQVIQGLAAAHSAGVVHRDLKADNILVGDDGRVVLTDFGLARLEDAEESRARLVGTPATWAPEQARGERATSASDVYSLGVVLYPWLAERSFQLSDEEAFDALPARYRAWFERCLATRPRDRFRNAQEAAMAWSQLHAARTRGAPRALIAAAASVLVAGVLAALATSIWRAYTHPVPTNARDLGGPSPTGAQVSSSAHDSVTDAPHPLGITPATVAAAPPQLDSTTAPSANIRRTAVGAAPASNRAHAGAPALGSASSAAASAPTGTGAPAATGASTARPLSTLLYRQ